jgi:hypothetical protein
MYLTLTALQASYPDYVPTKKKSPGYWEDKKNQKEFFDQLASKWNIQKSDDWNKVTTQMVLKEGGSFITHYYNGSLTQGNILEIICKFNKDQHYKRYMAIIFQQRRPKDIGKTRRTRKISLIGWLSNGIFKSLKIGMK